jgi:hypothetical protein
VNTSREEVTDNIGSDNFVVDEIPTKMILVDSSSPDGETHLIVYHSGILFLLVLIFLL